MAYVVPPEPPDEACVLVRSLAQGAPLLRLYRRQGPIWLRDGNGAYAVWEHLVEWDENHAPVVVVAQSEAEAAEAKVRGYESAINWDTTCTSCAATLAALRAQEERAEKAEAELERLRASLGQPAEVWGNVDDQGVFRSARDRQEADACTAEHGGWHGMRTARRLVYTTAPERVGTPTVDSEPTPEEAP